MQSTFPLGFNDNIYHEGNITKIPDFDVFSVLECIKRKRSAWLIFIFKFLAYLSLRHLELEANKLYDRANKLYEAALLTRCYVQHFFSPYINSEVNHKRHFIKIPFINKSIEFIDLHSIFMDNLVISSIPNYTGPRSAVGNVSGYGCVSDCRSRGREFDPGPVPYFRGD